MTYFGHSDAKDGFITTGLGDGIGISFRNTENEKTHGTKDKFEDKIENDDRNTVISDWKYWDDLPDEYRRMKKRRRAYINKLR